MAVKVTGVQKGTPAQKLGLSGCTLLSIDGNEINDMLDYEFYSQGPVLELAVVRGAKLEYVRAEKEEYAPLGCEFESYLIDKKHACKNKCMFCFIDQMPKRIIRMHISPINISVHTMDPQLRVKMMKNKHAGEVLAYLPRFAAAGIEMNCQLVLCRGINDGDALRHTLRELGALYPAVKSIAAVPSGLTKYREGLYPLQPYDRQTACEVLDILEEFGQRWREAHGVRLIYPGDEWFLLAGRPIPPEEYYDGYPQLENGVGMWRLLHDDFLTALPGQKRTLLPRRLDVVTGELAYPLISSLCQTLGRLHRNVHVQVHCIQNDFFGGNVGVAGLVTATDIIRQVKGKLKSRTLGIPEVMLREEKDKFLDDVTVKELERALGVRVRILPQDGAALVKALCK